MYDIYRRSGRVKDIGTLLSYFEYLWLDFLFFQGLTILN